MLTPQEVSEHAFAKAGFGGYNMAMVDEFLDQLTEDYTTLYKENAALKSKMKVLVEKVEEYRSTEDAMRKTLLTAQKMADDMVKEAEEKRASRGGGGPETGERPPPGGGGGAAPPHRRPERHRGLCGQAQGALPA